MIAPFETQKLRWPDSVGAIWSQILCETTLDVVIPLLQQDPDASALIFEDDVIVTRGALLDGVERFASHLRDRLRPGDRVILAIGNRAEFFIAWLSILANRGVPVIISPDLGSYTAIHIAHDSGAVLAIADGTAADVLRSVTAGSRQKLEVISVAGEEPNGFDHLGVGVESFNLGGVNASIHEPAGIHYTSGTTGPPKGCVHDHRQYIRYADIGMRLYPFAASDRLLNTLQFHYGDSVWLWIIALKLGADFVSVRKFSVSRFWPNVDRLGVTMFLGIGAIPNLLLTVPPSDLERGHKIRFAMQVGVPGAQHAELVERFGFPWVEGYGMSETGVTICMPLDSSNDYIGTGAIGIPVPEVDVTLHDDAGEKIEGPGIGQLSVRTPDMMLGYFNLPDATAEVLHDGWLRTGDLVRRDENDVYYFLGRTKLIIRRGGENVAPEEVEAVLRMHPSVVDAAVVPVADELRGEEIKAYVQLEDGASFEPQILSDFCAAHLSAFKVPRYFQQQTAAFPRTPSLRIQKSALAIDGVHQVTSVWDGDESSTRGVRTP